MCLANKRGDDRCSNHLDTEGQTMQSNRRDVLKLTGGALTAAAGGAGQVAAQKSEENRDMEEETNGSNWDTEPLANAWMHGGPTDPFKGAHGRHEWSPWPIKRRAEKLSEVGFNAIGLIQPDINHILEFEFAEEGSRRSRLQRLNSVLEQNGIDFVELEFLVEWPLDEDDPRRQAEQEDRELLLETAEVLDANHIKIGNINGYPRSTEDLQQKFADISEEFSEVDTEVGLEFFPVDPNVEELSDALEITEEAENGGLYLDLWHIMKLDIDFDAIRSLSGDDIVAVEFNDGYIDTEMPFFEETINLRKLPGEGEFPISDFIDAVREGGFSGPWGLEILSEEFRRFSMDDAYPRAYDAGVQYL